MLTCILRTCSFLKAFNFHIILFTTLPGLAANCNFKFLYLGHIFLCHIVDENLRHEIVVDIFINCSLYRLSSYKSHKIRC